MNLLDHEQQYRSAIHRIAMALVVFLITSNLFGMIGIGLAELWPILLEEPWDGVADTLTQAIASLLGVLVPILLFRTFSHGHPCEPMHLSPRLPRETPAYILAGCAIVSAAAYLNYYMVYFTGYTQYTSEFVWTESYATPHDILLSFLTMAVVPAFVEELFFRGLIQSNLRPFGRRCAILGSALIFGVAHQNLEQMLYATVAGLVFGYIYEVTESIWCGILFHMFNNGLAVLQGVIAEHWGDAAISMQVMVDGIVVGLGAIALVWLICRRKPKPDLSDGCFARTLPSDPAYTRCPIEGKKLVKEFFSPLMVTYFTFCLFTAVTIFVIAMLTIHVM